MEKDLFTLINEKLSGLSKGHKLIANYILSHYDKAAFMTAQKLGKTVGVSESTVVRFASELGYERLSCPSKRLAGAYEKQAYNCSENRGHFRPYEQ